MRKAVKSKPVKKLPKKTTKQVGQKAVAPIRDLNRPEYFINRELSWLEFNQRVLEEAQDATNPLLERLKFLSIVASNLDEFFEVRVAGLQQQAEARPTVVEADGLNAQQTLDAIAPRVDRMVRDQYRCYGDEIVPGLAAHGIKLQTINDLNEAGRAWAKDYFRREVFPILTPLAIDPAHPFPQLLNKSLNLAVALSVPNTPGAIAGLRATATPEDSAAHEATRFGVVQVPRALPRLVAVPPAASEPGRKTYVFLSSIISEYIDELFPGLYVEGCYAFRLTRNSELYLDEDEADNLLEAMQTQLQRRRRGDGVRLEVQRGCDPAIIELLLRIFELDPIDLFEVDGPINLTRLMAVYAAENRPDLKDRSYTPATPRVLRGLETPDDLFAAIRHEDILLHHPYESFQGVIDFITMAANDSNVLAIKQTLYRTSGDSPIVRALMRAAQNGKQVTALVELKARFDEENNIQWARAMEEAGVHVLYGLVGLKTHSKLALVVRREGDTMRRYVHMGTGNYNEITARLYTDVGMLTARPAVGEDAAKIFNLLTGMSQFPTLQELWMAPFGLHQEMMRLIERETANAGRGAKTSGKATGGKGKKPKPGGRIIAKMNALVDPEIIQALYRASQAGVQIDLIVRGVCCLRPGVPGVSDNIRVRSIVDRFLEHSRIFYFYNNGDDEVYCGSADWMPRNFFSRVEVIFPVADPALKARLRDEILEGALRDNVKARCIREDGTHWRLKTGGKTAPCRFQQWLLAAASPESSGPAEADLRTGRPAHLTDAPAAWGGGGQRGAVPPSIALRPAPIANAPLATDGRAGTMADPVLQSLARSVRSEGPALPAPTLELPLDDAPTAAPHHGDKAAASGIDTPPAPPLKSAKQVGRKTKQPKSNQPAPRVAKRLKGK